MKVIGNANTNLPLGLASGKTYVASAMGTFGGATVTLELFVDEEWFPAPDGVWTAGFRVTFVNDDCTKARLVVTNSTGTTNISLNLVVKAP